MQEKIELLQEELAGLQLAAALAVRLGNRKLDVLLRDARTTDAPIFHAALQTGVLRTVMSLSSASTCVFATNREPNKACKMSGDLLSEPELIKSFPNNTHRRSPVLLGDCSKSAINHLSRREAVLLQNRPTDNKQQ